MTTRHSSRVLWYFHHHDMPAVAESNWVGTVVECVDSIAINNTCRCKSNQFCQSGY
jgi:hypothetical protein